LERFAVRKHLSLGFLVAISFAFSACTKGGGDDNGGGGNNPPSSGSGQTECGVVSDGRLINPDPDDGEFVQVVGAISVNLVVIADGSTGANRRVIKLQGVGESTSAFGDREGRSDIIALTSNGAYFFKATEDCEAVFSNGSRGSIGSLLTPNGKSVAEELIRKRYAPVDRNDACGGALLGGCLSQVQSTTPEGSAGNIAGGFLWKPISENDGNLVIQVFECDAKIEVRSSAFPGTVLSPQNLGSGNARCSTFRFDKPGCAFGAATVRVLDRDTGLPYLFRGSPDIEIANGCQRFEIPR
jgi:hypothetical protein